MKKVFAFSDFAARYCGLHPNEFLDLVKSGDLFDSYRPGECGKRLGELFFQGKTSKTVEAPFSLSCAQKILRKFRNREMVRIAWRDISGRADLFETMEDLSSLADACLDHTVSLLYDDLSLKWGIPYSGAGKPQGLIVLGMGKLGGRELNFSSDIDLILAYPEKGWTKGGKKSIGNEEFFTRLGTLLAKVIGEKTPDGLAGHHDIHKNEIRFFPPHKFNDRIVFFRTAGIVSMIFDHGQEIETDIRFIINYHNFFRHEFNCFFLLHLRK